MTAAPFRPPSSVEAGGHRLEVAWHGPPPDRATTLVFLHEGLGCVAMWRDFPARVASATGCGALVYSRWGYGASDPITPPRPVRYMHDEALVTLPELLAKLEVRDAILVGHSDGASIAIIHAACDRAANVRALVLEAPHVFVEDLSVASIEKSKTAYLQGDLREKLAKRHGLNVDGAFWGWNGVWLDPAFRSWNIEACLPNVRVPVLVLQGEDDEYGTMAQVEAIEARCGGRVERVVVADCGHAPHKDQPEIAAAKMIDFIGRVVAR